MQSPPYSRRTSVLIISLLTLLERFGYYGMRALIVLYAISTNGLNLANENVMSYYGTFTLIGITLLIPTGLISDLFFKQRKGVQFGGFIALLGYALLLVSNKVTVLLAVILIVIGTAFIKTNLIVLLGCCYPKSEKRRDIGFIIFYTAINIGAFLGSLGVGYVGETQGYSLGFGMCVFALLLFVLFFSLTKNRLSQTEVTDVTYLENSSLSKNRILDNHLLEKVTIQSGIQTKKSLILIVLVILANFFFFGIYDIFASKTYALINEMPKIELLGIEIFKSIAISTQSYLSLIFLLGFLFFWHLNGLGSSLLKIGMALLLAVCSMFLIDLVPPEILSFSYLLLPFSLFAIGEILIAPIALSYITRLSPVKYSSVIYATFAASSYLLTEGLRKIGIDFFDYSFTFSLIALTFGLMIIVFWEKLVELAGHLD